MTIDQLETLEMIVEKGSFKAASESLNKTQPSLSVAIKKLEDEFELKIFNRDEYRPKLTPEGLVFLNWAKQCLQSFRDLKTVGIELGSKKVEPFLCLVLDPLVRFEAIQGVLQETVLSKYPTEVTFRSEIMSAGMELLISKEVNFSISTKVSDDDSIESFPFDKIEMIPVIAKSLSKKIDQVSFKNLKQVPQVLVQSLADRNFINLKEARERELRNQHNEARKCFVTDHNLKHQMIENGFGWGTLPRNAVEHQLKKGLLIEIEDRQLRPFVLDLHIMRLKNRPMGPVAKAVWAQLIKNASMNKMMKD